MVSAIVSCAPATRVSLENGAEKIEIVSGEPDRNKCKFLGDVQGEAKASDIGVATTNARNDIKNKSKKLGADIVMLDGTVSANAMDWSGRNKVVLTGRAFSCSDH